MFCGRPNGKVGSTCIQVSYTPSHLRFIPSTATFYQLHCQQILYKEESLEFSLRVTSLTLKFSARIRFWVLHLLLSKKKLFPFCSQQFLHLITVNVQYLLHKWKFSNASETVSFGVSLSLIFMRSFLSEKTCGSYRTSGKVSPFRLRSIFASDLTEIKLDNNTYRL